MMCSDCSALAELWSESIGGDEVEWGNKLAKAQVEAAQDMRAKTLAAEAALVTAELEAKVEEQLESNFKIAVPLALRACDHTYIHTLTHAHMQLHFTDFSTMRVILHGAGLRASTVNLASSSILIDLC